MSIILLDDIRPGDAIKVTTWSGGVLVERSGTVAPGQLSHGVFRTEEGSVLWDGGWAGSYSFELIDRPQQREFKGLTQEWAPEPDKESPEAQWSMTETEFNRELENAREEGRSEARKEKDLELHYRLAALQQSVAFWGDNASGTSSKVVNVANTFETFLRDGKRI